MIKRAGTYPQRHYHLPTPDKHAVQNFLVTPGELESDVVYVSRSVIEKGFQITYHVHDEEVELFSIVSGNAYYNDNGFETEVHPGDSLYCPDHTGHSIGNFYDEDVVVIEMGYKLPTK